MNRWKILIVEDDPYMHEVTALSLKRFEYRGSRMEFLNASSAAEAKEQLNQHDDIAVILLDVVMENDDTGLRLAHYIRHELGNDVVQIILRTGQPGSAPESEVILKYEINDYQEKSELTVQKLKTSIITALRAYENMQKLRQQNGELQQLYKNLEEAQHEIYYVLGEIAESRSEESGNHVKRVGEIVEFLAEKAGVAEEDLTYLKMASMLHDIGKLTVPEHILNKPGKLTEEEFSIMKTHSASGHSLLRNSRKELLRLASVIAQEHHENYDGSGYPNGLKGDQITLISRIVAIADVYDALGTKRVYKEAWTNEAINKFMQEQTGKKFDPELMTIFFDHIDTLNKIRERHPD